MHPGRRSVRLKEFDYSKAGAYFVTICTKDRECLFGEIIDEKVRLTQDGRIADEGWRNIPEHYPHVVLDDYVIMPNHVHGVIFISDDDVGVQNFEPLPVDGLRKNKYQQIIPKSIGSIVRGFKIGVTKWYRQNTDVHTVWQRNYFDRIIRDEDELNRIREYIIFNPAKWADDSPREIFLDLFNKKYEPNTNLTG